MSLGDSPTMLTYGGNEKEYFARTPLALSALEEDLTGLGFRVLGFGRLY